MSSNQPVTGSTAPAAAVAQPRLSTKPWVIATVLAVGAVVSSVGSYAFSQTPAGQATERTLDGVTADVDTWFESTAASIENVLP